MTEEVIYDTFEIKHIESIWDAIVKIEKSTKQYIIGCDEVGNGALAGPIVVCAVKALKSWKIDGLKDSKKIKSLKKRESIRDMLSDDKNISFHIAERSNIFLDKVGIVNALNDAYIECFNALNNKNEDLIVVDGLQDFSGLGVDHMEIIDLIRADDKVPTVMAASILAKTYRDQKMKDFHLLHPMYGWESNVGYGAKDHLMAISKYGPCPLHRFSYAPMKNMQIKDDRQLNLFE